MLLPSWAVNVTAALENLTKRSPPWMLSCTELNYMETKGLGEDFFFSQGLSSSAEQAVCCPWGTVAEGASLPNEALLEWRTTRVLQSVRRDRERRSVLLTVPPEIPVFSPALQHS